MYIYTLCALLFVLKSNYGRVSCDPASNFHTLVQPVLHHARTKRQITTTKHTDGLHHPEVTVTLDIDGEPQVLELRLNTDLVAGDHVVSYQKDGETVLHKPTMGELDICQYSGRVRDKEGSWAALSTCDGVRGIIHDGKQMRYIEPVEEPNIYSKHHIYDYTFSAFDKNLNITENANSVKKSQEQDFVTRHKRESKVEEKFLRGPFNADQDSRYLELVLVADYSFYNDSGKDISKVHKYLKDTANIVFSLFAQLNIFVVLSGVVVWNERDEIKITKEIDTTLDNFLVYRTKKLVHTIPNDNAQLVTNTSFSYLLGHAVLGTICTQNSSGGINTNTGKSVLLASTMAHTLGHNFGLNHDGGPDCQCEKQTCVMSPFLAPFRPWSYCSFKDLSKGFKLGIDYCLRNKPVKLYGPPICGNGFVESGEQCDCGVDTWISACTKCCDPKTCLFLPNATCAVDVSAKKMGIKCRGARRECDLPEYCNGNSEYCPEDVYKMDTTPCLNNEGYCSNGKCSSHLHECRRTWGPTGKVADKICYKVYNNGSNTTEDALCGLLHCQIGGNSIDRKELQRYRIKAIRNSYDDINDTKGLVECISMKRFKESTSNTVFGYVPDGAKCGDEKMCLNQKCVPIAAIRENITKLESSVCPSNCSGHGVCNSKGHCHCDLGFSPPNCEYVIVGGSIDSGPVLNTNEGTSEQNDETYVKYDISYVDAPMAKAITRMIRNKGATRRNYAILNITLILVSKLIFELVLT